VFAAVMARHDRQRDSSDHAQNCATVEIYGILEGLRLLWYHNEHNNLPVMAQ
jgi:hypothetical protein